MDGRDVNEERLEELISVLKLKRREETSAKPALRRTAAESFLRKGAHERSGHRAGRRADWKSGFQKQPGDHAAAPILNEKYNQTMLVITHDENIALQADRILSLEDGRS